MSTQKKQKLFLAITLAFPLLFFLAIEGALRIFWSSGSLPLFVRAPIRGDYLVANPKVARRWFSYESMPPAPISEPFARQKPSRAFRVFVLGESSTAGFPFPRNVTFSRYVRDVLTDVLPGDSVEVINLGIAATNSYAMLDQVNEVVAQRPDAVLIYAGHNEWYGALGVGSTESWASNPALVRLTLGLQRWRTVLALRHLVAKVRGRPAGAASPEGAVSLMETLARNKDIAIGSPEYERGVHQFESNLGAIVARLQRHGIPVFVGSLASNLRQRPFYSPGNDSARAAFARAARSLGSGDSAAAKSAFAAARDLDVVRFRAPTAFDSIIRRICDQQGAIYVPVHERFDSAAIAHIPGNDLFLEHVHPTAGGYALLGRTFAESMLSSKALNRADRRKLRAWSEYDRGRWLTDFDLMIAEHQRRGLLQRWPFVAPDSQRDYRNEHVPTTLVDSAAFAVVRGAPWEIVKVQLGEEYERRKQYDLAIAEYRGLARDTRTFESPLRFLGRALVAANRYDEAEAPLRQAMAILPTSGAAHSLARVLLRRRQLAEGIQLLEFAVRAEPNRPDMLYELALAKALNNDVTGAREATMRLAQVAPNHPGLPDLVRALGGGAAPTSPRRAR